MIPLLFIHQDNPAKSHRYSSNTQNSDAQVLKSYVDFIEIVVDIFYNSL